MKRIILTLMALAASLTALAGGKIVTDSLRSEILGATVKYNVYLPEGFDKSTEQYPVVYLLHGLYNNYKGWVEKGFMKGVADEFMASGECRKAVIIMPNAGDKDAYTYQNGYFNVKDWNYEDFFFQELMPTLEKKYRCISDKGHRAIMGLSMGGGGSTVYCQRHPDMFSSCYAMSAWLDDMNFEQKQGWNHDNKLYITCASVREHDAVAFVENADEATVEQLKTVKWFFDCGDDDYLVALSYEIHMKMADKGIQNELRVRDGIHNWEYWHAALRIALPFASRNFEK